MRYGIRQNGNVTILDVSGRISLDEPTSEPDATLRLVIRNLVNDGRRKLVLNLKEVTYVDSSGVGELISCWTAVRERGGALKIVNPPKQVKELLRLTRLDTVIDVIGDEAAAVNSYRRSVKIPMPGLSWFEP